MTVRDVEDIIRDTVKYSYSDLNDKRCYPDLYHEIKNNIQKRINTEGSYSSAWLEVNIKNYDTINNYCLDIKIMYRYTEDPDIFLFYNFEDFIYEFVAKHRKIILDELLS